MGYDLALFESSPEEHLICSICNSVFKDPIIGCEQGHPFCTLCLDVIRGRQSACVACRMEEVPDAEAGWAYSSVPCRPIAKLAGALRTRCVATAEEGGAGERCGWAGPLTDYSLHLKRCEFVRVECSFVGCSHVCRRTEMARHQENCEHRPLPCRFCGAVLPPQELKVHIEEACPEAPVPCLLACCGCEVRPRRREQADHQFRAADSHAALISTLSARVAAIAEPTDWILDEAQAVGVLTRMLEAAIDEVSRNSLTAQGALQTALGLMASRRASAAVQTTGCRALATLCTSDTRGLMAFMRISGQDRGEGKTRVINPAAAAKTAAQRWRGRATAATGSDDAGPVSVSGAAAPSPCATEGDGALSGGREATEVEGEGERTRLPRLKLPLPPTSATAPPGPPSHPSPTPHSPHPPPVGPSGLVKSPGRHGRVQLTIAPPKGAAEASRPEPLSTPTSSVLSPSTASSVLSPSTASSLLSPSSHSTASKASGAARGGGATSAASRAAIEAANEALQARVQCAIDAGALEALVAALHSHLEDASVQQRGCEALAALCDGGVSGMVAGGVAAGGGLSSGAATSGAEAIAAKVGAWRQRAFDAGVLACAAHALRAFVPLPAVLQSAASIIRTMCVAVGSEAGDDALMAHRGAAAEDGVIESLAVALVAHPHAAGLQEGAYRALCAVCSGTNADARFRKLRALDAGALEATQTTVIAHSTAIPAHQEAVRCLVALCSGLASMGKQRQHRAAEAGAVRIVVHSLLRRTGAASSRGSMAMAHRALRNLVKNLPELQELAIDEGAQTEWFQ